MKYVSELTNKVYDTVEDLEAAEKEFNTKKAAEDEKKKQREARAAEVKEAYKKANEARAAADKLMRAFLEDYPGGYYTTIKSVSPQAPLDNFIRTFFGI